MSEDGRPADGAAPSREDAGAPNPTFGQRLAAAREGAGLGVGDVAAHLRLHVNQVRALESGNLASLPEPAYVRGFVRSYARLVGLDAGPLLEDLNSRLTPASESVVEGMARTRDYSPVKAAAQEQSSRVFVLGLAVAALIVLGLVGWYATREGAIENSPAAASSPPAPAAVVEQAAVPATTEPDRATVPATRTDAAPGGQPVETPQPESSAGAEPAGVLTLRFSGVSWVEVTDANGKVLLSQIVQPGETHQPTGALPLTVVIGDASKAAVAVRGQPFSIESVTRANVARFIVK